MMNPAKNPIQFVLDGSVVIADFSVPSGISPTTTILNYLRSLPGHKGVKEGCAEGDCGACTVVLGEPGKDGKMRYRSVDSCLVFLPMIHGKQLITVENLAIANNDGTRLHPVQELMVETNGSQCGYCTPGIVMSLFGLYRNHNKPSRDVIGDALAGNLCRCTGYQPILEAAQKACVGERKDHFSENEQDILDLLKGILSNKETIEISTGKQRYFKPFTLTEALRIRKETPDALIINGSTDVALRQTKKHELLTSLLDISDVDGLAGISDEADRVIIGAGATMEMVKQSVERDFPSLHKILKVFGSLQIRNLATIGGNICSASPIGDVLPVLIAYGATVRLNSLISERTMPLEEFITDYRKTALGKDELLSGIEIPKPGRKTKIFSYKVSRRKDLDISTLSAGFRLEEQSGKISAIILAYGGMAEKVKRAQKTENFLLGKKWTRENILESMPVLAEEFTPISDARSEAAFRMKVAQNLLLKFFLETEISKKPTLE
jgi:xanthine dehydrogenase small subunit